MTELSVATDRHDRREIAPRWHTFVLIGALLLPIILHKPVALGTAMRNAPADLVPLYLKTIALEWALFAFVWYGLRKEGVSIEAITGRKWLRGSAAAGDVAIGIGFAVAAVAVSTIALHLRSNVGAEVGNILPRTAPEIGVWILLSVSAGIVEEAVYRGYLQTQFQRFGLPPSIAVLAQALLFGTVHAYQGSSHVASIAVIGLIAGAIAEWRRSVRPTMIGHSLQDIAVIFRL